MYIHTHAKTCDMLTLRSSCITRVDFFFLLMQKRSEAGEHFLTSLGESQFLSSGSSAGEKVSGNGPFVKILQEDECFSSLFPDVYM